MSAFWRGHALAVAMRPSVSPVRPRQAREPGALSGASCERAGRGGQRPYAEEKKQKPCHHGLPWSGCRAACSRVWSAMSIAEDSGLR